MTAQLPEMILYNNKIYGMATEPLEKYLQEKKDIEFRFFCSACWRSYIGAWEIKDNMLFLCSIAMYLVGYEEPVGIDVLFPNRQKVFAEWFSGEIRIPEGKMLHYVHRGYESIYEKDIFLDIHHGKLTGKREVENYNKVAQLKAKENNQNNPDKSLWRKILGIKNSLFYLRK